MITKFIFFSRACKRIKLVDQQLFVGGSLLYLMVTIYFVAIHDFFGDHKYFFR